jgi:hypothetical protein
LSATGLRSVAAAGLSSDIIPVDEFLLSMYMVHPRADIATLFPSRLRAYALATDIVEPGPATEDTDTEQSPFLQ